ncbi:MAG: acyl carrier protein [Blastocatellia bacterium]
MKERVIRIVSQVMGVPMDQVTEGSSSQTVETWDSLNHMNLILALEEEFGVQFSDEQIMRMLNVGAILAEMA